jgi:Holliday junction DNA helicase RuvA
MILLEAESALVSLGYKPAEAARMLNKFVDQATTSEELIRLALKNSLGNT